MDYTVQQSSEVVSTYIVEEDSSGSAMCQMCSQKIVRGSMLMGKVGVVSKGLNRHQQMGYTLFPLNFAPL